VHFYAIEIPDEQRVFYDGGIRETTIHRSEKGVCMFLLLYEKTCTNTLTPIAAVRLPVKLGIVGLSTRAAMFLLGNSFAWFCSTVVARARQRPRYRLYQDRTDDTEKRVALVPRRPSLRYCIHEEVKRQDNLLWH